MNIAGPAPFNPTIMSRLYEEWLSNTIAGNMNWVAANSGAGTSVSITATPVDKFHPGWIQLSTGTTAAGRSGINLGAANAVITNGVIYNESVIMIPNLPDGIDNFAIRWGWGSVNTGDHTNGVYFEFDPAVGTTWYAKTARASTRTTQNTGVTVLANSYIRLGIQITNGSKAEYYINGNLVATITATFPDSFTGVFFTMNINKSLGTNARFLWVDNWYYNQSFSAER